MKKCEINKEREQNESSTECQFFLIIKQFLKNVLCPLINLRRVLKSFFPVIFIDLLAVTFVMTGLLIDRLYFIETLKCRYSVVFEYSDIVVAALLSLTITFVSIISSLSKNSFYGIKIGEVQKILFPKFYSLKHIFVDSVVIFLFNILFKFHHLRFADQILEVVTLIMCFLFGFEEIMIYTSSRFVAKHLIRWNLKNGCFEEKIDNKNKINKKYNSPKKLITRKLLTNYILTEGIGIAFLELNKIFESENELVGLLFEYQNKYFNDLSEYIKSRNNVDTPEYFDGLSVVNSIKKGYENIAFVVVNCRKDLLNQNVNVVYASTVCLNEIVKTLQLDNIKNDAVRSMFYDLESGYFHLLYLKVSNIIESLKNVSKTDATTAIFNEFLQSNFDKFVKEISKFEKLKQKEISLKKRQTYKGLFDSFIDVQDKMNKNKNLYFSYLAFNTIKNDDISFVDSYRISCCSNLFNKKFNRFVDFSYFATFLIIYLLENTNDKEKTSLFKVFTLNYIDDIKTSYSWQSLFVWSVQTLLSEDELIQLLFLPNSLISNFELEFYGIKKGLLLKDKEEVKNFDKVALYKYWLGCVFIRCDFDKDEIKRILSKVIDEHGDFFDKCLEIGSRFSSRDFEYLNEVLDTHVQQNQLDEIINEIDFKANETDILEGKVSDQRKDSDLENIKDVIKTILCKNPIDPNLKFRKIIEEKRNNEEEWMIFSLNLVSGKDSSISKDDIWLRYSFYDDVESKEKKLLSKKENLGKTFELYVDFDSIIMKSSKLPFDIAFKRAKTNYRELNSGLYEYKDEKGNIEAKNLYTIANEIYSRTKVITICFYYALKEKNNDKVNFKC